MVTDISKECLYAERDPAKLEPHFSNHLSAMTGERLHSKAAIAMELAYRDQQLQAREDEVRRLTEEKLELLDGTARQLAHTDGETGLSDSMAISTTADALLELAKHGRFRITKEVGRRIIGCFPENDPELLEASDD